MVQADKNGKYLKLVDDINITVYSAVEILEKSIVFDAIESHEYLPTYDDFSMLLIQNILRPFDGRYPGKVEETRNLEEEP